MKERTTNDAGTAILLVTIDEAARRLAIGRSHVYAQIQSGNLRSVRIGRSRRILENDLETFIEELLDGPGRDTSLRSSASKGGAVKKIPPRHGRR